MKPIIILLSLIIFTSSASAGDTTQCNIDKFATYSKAKQDFQANLAKLAISTDPKVKAAATFFMNAKIMMLKQQTLAVKLLLTNDPQKVQTSERLRRWLILQSEDDKTLSNLSPQYASLTTAIAKARERKDLSDSDELQQVMQTKVVPSPQFRKLYEALNGKINKINRIRCQ